MFHQLLTRYPPPPILYAKRLLEALDLVQPVRLVQDVVAMRHEQHAGVVEGKSPCGRHGGELRNCQAAVDRLRRLVERVDDGVDHVDRSVVQLLGLAHPGEEVRLVRFHQRSDYVVTLSVALLPGV
jgi:hypothetical protein